MIFSLAITGPTASGKTAMSIGLAKALSGEIVSSDSMQIYRGMDIGTAKATPSEQAMIPHHLINIVDPHDAYSVERYREDALTAARDIASRGKIPIFVGGTGLYLDSLTRGGADNIPVRDEKYTERIMASVNDESDIDKLWERLRDVDPESAEKIHKNNLKRVIRALEIYDTVGVPKSLLDKESRAGESEIFVGMITLDFHSRDTLYERIDRRVDIMMEEGLLSECERLYLAGMSECPTAAQAIGYKELFAYFRGETSLEEAIEAIKLASRRYAKRQLTWFRRKDAIHIYADRESGGMKSDSELLCEAMEAYAEYFDRFKRI